MWLIALFIVVLIVGGWLGYEIYNAPHYGRDINPARDDDEQEAARTLWRAAINDSEDTYGQAPGGDFNAVLRSRAEDAT